MTNKIDAAEENDSAGRQHSHNLRGLKSPESKPANQKEIVSSDSASQTDIESEDNDDETAEESKSATQKEVVPSPANDEGDNEPNLIHILETRFMQNQPNLVQLAKARLHLFRTICIPTVLHQTAWGRFFWIIRTDPDLDDEIKKELVTILDETGVLEKDDEGKGHSLAYVIGSNENYIVSESTTISPDHKPFDIHDMLSSALSNPESIFAGEAEGLKQLYGEISSQQIENDVLIWTRLDADDGLNTQFMQYVQSQTVRYFLPDLYSRKIVKEIPEDTMSLLREKYPAHHKTPDEIAQENDDNAEEEKVENQTMISNTFNPPQWSYWCAGKNIDWFLTDPIHDPRHKNGTVYPVFHANVCVTPGITVAFRGAFDPIKVPRLDHDRMASHLRTEGGELCGRTGLSIFDERYLNMDEEEEDEGTCFHMVHEGASAVRSRTPTSAGMMGVTSPTLLQMKIIEKMPTLTSIMWKMMEREFSISNEDLLATNSYFAEHIYDIAEENARGQCTNGHSCKTSSKDLLQQYVDLKGEKEGGFDIVDERSSALVKEAQIEEPEVGERKFIPKIALL